MVAYRIAQCKYIEDLSGIGASFWGGRWNSQGNAMLYSSENSATSLLEHIVHRSPFAHSQEFCMVKMEFPKSFKAQTLTTNELPEGWDQFPSIEATRIIGDKWLSKGQSEILKVPSAIDHLSCNLLFNPNLKSVRKALDISLQMPLRMDQRLLERLELN